MSYPRLIINPDIIKKNTQNLVKLTSQYNIDVAGVTKGFCAHPQIVKAYIEGGVKYLADSRVINLKRLKEFDIPKMMIKIPMISEANDIVKYSDISLNSEIETIKALSVAANQLNKIHNIILMVDLGDLREGYFDEGELFKAVSEIIKLKGINLIGLGANFTCYGGVIPNKRILDKLYDMSRKIEDKYGIKLKIISGGNSSSIYLLGKENIVGTNNLRLGETLLFGTESAYGKQIEGTSPNAFTLEAEIIEIKYKPSVPTEEIGKDAFGKIPTFVDRGIRKRILCAVGKQDIDFDTIYPYDKDLIILGGSSDHLILDGSDSKIAYKVGDIIEFNIHYVSLLRIMTSEYVDKIWTGTMSNKEVI